MTDSMGQGKLIRHMQKPSYTYDEYLICIGVGQSISSVICKNLSYSGPSYPSSPVYLLAVVWIIPNLDRIINQIHHQQEIYSHYFSPSNTSLHISVTFGLTFLHLIFSIWSKLSVNFWPLWALMGASSLQLTVTGRRSKVLPLTACWHLITGSNPGNGMRESGQWLGVRPNGAPLVTSIILLMSYTFVAKILSLDFCQIEL